MPETEVIPQVVVSAEKITPEVARRVEGVAFAMTVQDDVRTDGGLYGATPELQSAREAVLDFKIGDRSLPPEAKDRGVRGLIDCIGANRDGEGNLTEAGRIAYDKVTGVVKVALKDGTGDTIPYAEWESKLNDESLPPEERAVLEQALLDFDYPEELEGSDTAGKVEEQITDQTAPEMVIIKSEIKRLEKELIGKGKEADPEKVKLLASLRQAELANGECGVLLKLDAFKNLQKSGIEVPEEIMVALGENSAEAVKVLAGHLAASGLSAEVVKGIREGTINISTLVEKGWTGKVENLSSLLFGKELDEKQIEGLVNPDIRNKYQQTIDELKKKGKSTRTLLLVILACVISDVVGDLIPAKG